MVDTNPIILETADAQLEFDAHSGRLIGFRPQASPEQQFIAPADDHPVFVVQYLDADRRYQQIDSFDASEFTIEREESGGGVTLTMRFLRCAGLDLDITATVRVSSKEHMSRWSVALRNGAGLEVVDVQFPFVVVAYAPGGASDDEAILIPEHVGQLIRDPKPQTIGPDHVEAWRMGPADAVSDRSGYGSATIQYPGETFAQFLAYFNETAGLYLACEDTEGNIKLFRALHRDPGIRLGVAHVGDWPRSGERQLEYDVVLRSFTGDWHAAAELYRSWSLQQKWATPLHQRRDVPDWLLDSPPHITLRLQGVLDEGPVFPVEEFLPYEKCIPLLEKVADRVEAPLVAVIMSWERAAPWVYPDCFPPVGGDESVTRFAAMARERGWHVGSFCNGTRWVMGHFWNRYDGRAYYEAHDGQTSVCRTPAGGPWPEMWDVDWRPSYLGCMGTALTCDLAIDFVQRLIGWGLESIQFFDQNICAATFPCFAHDHEHPPMPGKWMNQKMQDLVQRFHAEARNADQSGALQSVESPCNEYCLPLFQQCDVRVSPQGTGHPHFVPLYHYLFHECIVMHGMMGWGPEPYHLPIRNALNAVLGEIPGGAMIGDGTLLNKNTSNWAPWEPRVGSDDDALEMIRTITALRRGPAKPFLVFGRMLSPSQIDGIETINWHYENHNREMPAVFHAAWQDPEGQFGVALANWTTDERQLSVIDSRLGAKATCHVSGRTMQSEMSRAQDNRIDITLPPLSCALVAANAS